MWRTRHSHDTRRLSPITCRWSCGLRRMCNSQSWLGCCRSGCLHCDQVRVMRLWQEWLTRRSTGAAVERLFCVRDSLAAARLAWSLGGLTDHDSEIRRGHYRLVPASASPSHLIRFRRSSNLQQIFRLCQLAAESNIGCSRSDVPNARRPFRNSR